MAAVRLWTHRGAGFDFSGLRFRKEEDSLAPEGIKRSARGACKTHNFMTFPVRGRTIHQINAAAAFERSPSPPSPSTTISWRAATPSPASRAKGETQFQTPQRVTRKRLPPSAGEKGENPSLKLPLSLTSTASSGSTTGAASWKKTKAKSEAASSSSSTRLKKKPASSTMASALMSMKKKPNATKAIKTIKTMKAMKAMKAKKTAAVKAKSKAAKAKSKAAKGKPAANRCMTKAEQEQREEIETQAYMEWVDLRDYNSSFHVGCEPFPVFLRNAFREAGLDP